MSDPAARVLPMSQVVIDCDRCELRGKGCNDCVMSFLLDSPRVLPLEEIEQRALGVLAEVGLVPPLRMELGNALKVV